MFGGGLPREEFFADGALTHALIDDKEHLADLVVARGAAARCVFSSVIMLPSTTSSTPASPLVIASADSEATSECPHLNMRRHFSSL